MYVFLSLLLLYAYKNSFGDHAFIGGYYDFYYNNPYYYSSKACVFHLEMKHASSCVEMHMDCILLCDFCIIVYIDASGLYVITLLFYRSVCVCVCVCVRVCVYVIFYLCVCACITFYYRYRGVHAALSRRGQSLLQCTQHRFSALQVGPQHGQVRKHAFPNLCHLWRHRPGLSNSGSVR